MGIKNLNLRKKMLLGIGASFLFVMLVLMIIVIYQFQNLLTTNIQLIEEELLQRERARVKTLVKTRARMLAQIYQKQQENAPQSEIKSLLAQFNNQADLDDNYFYIYSLQGKTISLPPTPYL